MKTKLFTFTFVLFTGVFFGQNALHFDGVNDAVNCGMDPSIQISGNSITCEAWIYVSSWKSNVWEGNIICSENNNNNNGYMLRAGDNGRLNFAFGRQNGSWNECTSSTGVLSLNTWTHVAGTFDGSMLRIYKNGVKVDSASATGPIGASGVNVTLGCRPDFVRFFHGKIDEARIWNVTRTKGEILQGMNTEFCGNQPGLMAYYKFNNGTAGGSNTGLTSLQDYAGSNTGTLTNFALSGNTSNWVSGKSLNIPAGDTTSMTDTICKKDKYVIGGEKIFEPGLHEVHLQKANGCDSLIYLTLHEDSVDATATVPNSFSIKANNPNATYQWLRCSTGFSIIFNETGQSYTPTDNDFYAVQVTKSNGCKDTSACLTLAQFSVNEFTELQGVMLLPNPAHGSVRVLSENELKGLNLVVRDLFGRNILSREYDLFLSTEIDIESLTPGIYFIQMETDRSGKTLRLVVE